MQKGFSLVELSIVLVILGLLTGGILAGQSLIRAAELRAVTSQVETYKTALFTFRDKYFALPGDMRNATDFWGVLAGTGADAACQNTIATGTPTCNGNGDGVILTSVVGSDERIRTWQHLANAGLIEGSYTGRTDGASGTYEITPGSNLPRSKAGATDFWDLLAFSGAGDGSTSFTEQNFFGPYFNYYGDVADFNSSINPEEAWNIDTKMDDGNPVTGNVYSTPATGGHPGCTTADDDTAEYDLTDTAAGCVLRFLTR